MSKINYKDKNTQKFIYEWLKVIINKKNIKGKKVDVIEKYFNTILNNTGIYYLERCEIVCLDKSKSIFRCYLDNKKEFIDIKLAKSDHIEFGPLIIVSKKNDKKVYEITPETNNNSIKIELTNVKKINPINNLVLSYFINSNYYQASWSCGDKKIRIDISYNKTINPFFSLEKMEYLLYEMKNPIEIEELYKKIEETLLVKIEDISSINIEFVQINRGLEKITDCMFVQNGKLILTRNDKIVVVKDNKNKLKKEDIKKQEIEYPKQIIKTLKKNKFK